MKKIFIKKCGVCVLQPVNDALKDAPDGLYSVEIKKIRKTRSLDQNAWLWGCVYPMLMDALLHEGWEFTDTEQVHDFFKAQMINDRVINKHTGEIVEFPASTAKMNTLTFATYCDKLREYASEYLNLEIPDPDPNWMLNKFNNNNLIIYRNEYNY
jgi:hypothetical protein